MARVVESVIIRTNKKTSGGGRRRRIMKREKRSKIGELRGRDERESRHDRCFRHCYRFRRRDATTFPYNFLPPLTTTLIKVLIFKTKRNCG